MAKNRRDSDRLSRAQLDKLYELWQAGYNLSDLAERYGLNNAEGVPSWLVAQDVLKAIRAEKRRNAPVSVDWAREYARF